MTELNRKDDILEMLPAFALGALDPDEMLAVEEYLLSHGTPDLQRRLQELEDAAAFMAFQAPAQPLPLHIKGQLFDAIQNELMEVEDRTPITPPSVRTTTAPRRPQRHPEPEPANSPFQRWLAVLGGLLRPAAWVAVGAALVFFLLQPTTQSAQGELALVRAEVQRLEGELQSRQGELTTLRDQNLALQQINQSLQSQVTTSDQQLAVLARPAHTIPLAGQDAAPGASGALYVGQGQSVLVLSGLEVLPENQTYQLWLIPADGAPLPSGLLTVAQTDVDSLTISLPDDAANYAAVGVSIEPAGGSSAPTGPIVLVGLTSS